MTTIISRAAAKLPPVPSSIGRRSITSWAGITVHHTGGAFSSWKAVHDWQTKGRPPADRLVYIGYSFGIAHGQVTELRGWDYHPAGDHENSRLQVVFGGNYTNGLPPSADLEAFAWFVGEARRRTGKALQLVPHSAVWPPGHRYATACPGAPLRGWLAAFAGLEEVDMADLANIEIMVGDTLRLLEKGERGRGRAETHMGGIPLAWIVRVIGEIQNKLNALSEQVQAISPTAPVPGSPLDPAALRAALVQALQDPAVMAKLATAVADETHRRMAG
ncbi:MAG TPA: peptidoglycan recognition family protein [Trueperaceae bacterium]